MKKTSTSEESFEKCCGNCCWFCHEDTDGWGFCNTPAKLPEHVNRYFTNCEMPGGTDCGFVSRAEMRHHMAVLLQYHMADEDMNHRFPGGEELEKAVVFAYKYMKVFSEL